MAVRSITEAEFEEVVLKSETPVFVDFFATWCGPCKMMSPVVDEIAEETDAIKVGKINVDEQMPLAQKYGVMSIPTLILFKNGEVAAQTVGAQPKAAILKMLEEA